MSNNGHPGRESGEKKYGHMDAGPDLDREICRGEIVGFGLERRSG
jgi:hypothetical protein